MSRGVKIDAQLGVSKEGYAGRIEVLPGPTGRWQRSEAEKARIAAESLAPVADIAADMGRPAGRYTIGVDAFGAATWPQRKRLSRRLRSRR